MSQSKTSTTKRPGSNLEILECKRQLNHPFVNPVKKSYYSGKLMAMESGTKKADIIKRKELAMKLIQSVDIFERAKGFGLLFDDPVFSSTETVEFSTYTLKQ